MTFDILMPEDIICGFLRKNMVDPKNRSENWIYPEKPQILDLLDSLDNFPIISVESMGINSVGQLAIDSTSQEDYVNILINVWSIKNDIVTLEEKEKEVNNSDLIQPITDLPFSYVTEIVGKNNPIILDPSEYTESDLDSDGFYDSVILNDSTAVQNFLSSVSNEYVIKSRRVGEGVDVVNYLAQKAHQLIRDNWHTSLTPFYLFDYQRISFSSVIFEENIRLYRKELQIRFNAINGGD